MRQAHPRNQTRGRIVAAGISLAISGTAMLVLSTSASGRAPNEAQSQFSLAPVVTSVERRDTVARRAPMAAPRVEALTTLDAAPARVPLTTRPPIIVPDVAPGVVFRLPVGARVVVLGDSYATGWKGAGLGERNWVTLVGRARGWTMVNLAVAGTGFKNAGWTNQPVASLVSEALRQHPDVVILAAGHNDSRWSAATTSKEADRVIDRLRAGLPDAVIVILAPIWQSGSPPTRCLILRDHLREKAAAVGGIFIDPLAKGWFAGANRRFIGADGLHPTNAGHRHIAELVLGDLGDLVGT